MAYLQALLVSERQITVADEEKLNLKTDDANFPWGIGGTTTKLLVSQSARSAIAP
jgi:hypothetical protein